MNQIEYAALVVATVTAINELSTVKGGEYAGDNDRLENFKRNAKNLGVNAETVWSVYAGKHWDSINQYHQDLQSGKERPRAESMIGRFDDLIVYCILGKALYMERNKDSAGTATTAKSDMYPPGSEPKR